MTHLLDVAHDIPVHEVFQEPFLEKPHSFATPDIPQRAGPCPILKCAHSVSAAKKLYCFLKGQQFLITLADCIFRLAHVSQLDICTVTAIHMNSNMNSSLLYMRWLTSNCNPYASTPH